MLVNFVSIGQLVIEN